MLRAVVCRTHRLNSTMCPTNERLKKQHHNISDFVVVFIGTIPRIYVLQRPFFSHVDQNLLFSLYFLSCWFAVFILIEFMPQWDKIYALIPRILTAFISERCMHASASCRIFRMNARNTIRWQFWCAVSNNITFSVVNLRWISFPKISDMECGSCVIVVGNGTANTTNVNVPREKKRRNRAD